MLTFCVCLRSAIQARHNELESPYSWKLCLVCTPNVHFICVQTRHNFQEYGLSSSLCLAWIADLKVYHGIKWETQRSLCFQAHYKTRPNFAKMSKITFHIINPLSLSLCVTFPKMSKITFHDLFTLFLALFVCAICLCVSVCWGHVCREYVCFVVCAGVMCVGSMCGVCLCAVVMCVWSMCVVWCVTNTATKWMWKFHIISGGKLLVQNFYFH